MKSLTNAEKIEVAKRYYSSFSYNEIQEAVLEKSYQIKLVTLYGPIWIKISLATMQISVHTEIACYGCDVLDKYL